MGTFQLKLTDTFSNTRSRTFSTLSVNQTPRSNFPTVFTRTAALFINEPFSIALVNLVECDQGQGCKQAGSGTYTNWSTLFPITDIKG